MSPVITVTNRNAGKAHKKVVAAYTKTLRGKMDDVLDAVADATETQTNEATSRVQVKTGNTRASIGDRFEDEGLTGITYVTSIVGVYLEFGTRAHIIRAKKAKALHFFTGGKEVFAKYVNHPGTKPYPFLRPAFKVASTQLMRDIDRIMKGR